MAACGSGKHCLQAILRRAGVGAHSQGQSSLQALSRLPSSITDDQPSTSSPLDSHKHAAGGLRLPLGVALQLPGWRNTSSLASRERALPGPQGSFPGPSHTRSISSLQGAATDPRRQVTNLLIALNLATYLMAQYDRGVVHAMAAIPPLMAKGEWYRLLSSGFMHADFVHLLTNMLSLHWLGPGVESAAGRGRFTAIYLASIVSGSLASYHLGPFATVSLGASGGIFGLLGAYVVYRARNRAYIGWEREDMAWLAQIVGLNVLIAFTSSGINHWAHLGGLLGGGAACWLIGPRFRWHMGRVVDQPLLPWLGPRRQ